MQPVRKMLTVMMFLITATATIAEAQYWRRPGPPPGRGPGPGRGWGIEIMNATYGANCGAQYNNVLWSVQRECQGQMSCAYTVSISKVGDPAYGCGKDFRMQYRCPNGQVFNSNLGAPADNQTAYMQCSGGGGGGYRSIRVLTATYGGNFPEIPKGNVTYDIANQCNGRQSCDYFITVSRLGDPKYGWSKDYRVEYTCNGRDVQTAYAAPEANTQTVRLFCY